MKKITLIVPCYNEEKALPFFFPEIFRVADEMKEKLADAFEGMDVSAFTKVEEDGTIKYAFDLLDTWTTHEFRPITAKDYYKVYRKYDREHFDEKDKRMIRNKIKYIDENFTLLTKEEVQEIFGEKYKW